MIELLKKIGIPATVAAVIASLVTMVPLLFKIDERYAKEEDLVAQTARTEKVINELTVEISRLAGTQQVMVTLMAAQNRQAPAPVAVLSQAPVPTPVPTATSDLNALPASNAGEERPRLRAAAPPPKPASAPKLDEVSRTLEAQQSRLSSLKY
jgi:hypothetical protein